MKIIWTILKTTLILMVMFFCSLWLSARLFFDRTQEFRLQAKMGQPIIKAINQFKNDTGQLPSSLTNLYPKYLPRLPDLPDKQARKLSGWEYFPVTNGPETTFVLRFYMGRGGVEYMPTNWFGNTEGQRKVLKLN